jgi:tripartite-type tricarboxylate transporter receptor subunit TctC
MMNRRQVVQGLAATFAADRAFAQSGAAAERYPARPIDLILPYSVGSSGDTAMRLLAEKMAPVLGRTLVPENLPGAGGLLGADKGRRAKPDGYTLISMADSTLMYLPLLNRNANFDPRTDYEPIAQIADIDWVLVANPALGVRSISDLVRLARERAGRLDYASGGIASPQQVVMELFKKRTGTDLNHIPYKGAAPALLDVVGGQVPVMFSGVPVAATHITSGKLVALATAGRRRSDLLPNVPTLEESGLQGFTYSSWVSLMGPRGLPADRINIIWQAVVSALGDPELVQKLRGLGMTPIGNGPAEFRNNLAQEYARLSDLVRDIGLPRT